MIYLYDIKIILWCRSLDKFILFLFYYIFGLAFSNSSYNQILIIYLIFIINFILLNFLELSILILNSIIRKILIRLLHFKYGLSFYTILRIHYLVRKHSFITIFKFNTENIYILYFLSYLFLKQSFLSYFKYLKWFFIKIIILYKNTR